MLVLTRRPGEVILVGSDVRITVVCIDRNKVRIGVEAPRDKTIVREELTIKSSDEGGKES